jgi:catalase
MSNEKKESIASQSTQKHLANALTFELPKVESEAIRLRMLGHLLLIDRALADVRATYSAPAY